MDFTAALSDMIRTDDASLLSFIIEPLLKLNIKKTFDIKTIDEALLVKPARYDKKEYVTEDTPEDIVYEDEIEDERIRHNYIFIMNNLKECINRKCMNKSDILTLGEFNNIMSEAYGEEILNNADYYSFIFYLIFIYYIFWCVLCYIFLLIISCRLYKKCFIYCLYVKCLLYIKL